MSNNSQHINPPELGDPSGYGFNNLVIVPAGHKLVFVAGQGGRNERGELGDFTAQLKQAFIRLRQALAAANATPAHVVKITVLSVDHNSEKQTQISAERNAMWPDELGKPASTLIPVPRLAGDGMLFEIDAIAAVPTS